MNIVVCIKQVPDTTEVRIDPVTNTLIRDGVPSIINPFDENAIEEGISLVEKHGGKVTVITMGPPQAEEALRRALSMGADEAVLVSSRAFAGSDTWATSYILAQAIRKLEDVDLVICGKQAFDGDTAQVGPGVAEQLGLPQATYVIAVEEVEGKRLRVRRVLEDRYEVLELRLPALITVVKQINEPRHPRLKNVMAAKRKTIPVWGPEEIVAQPSLCGLDGSPTNVIRIFLPERSHEGEMLEGSTEDVVTRLIEKLHKLELV